MSAITRIPLVLLSTALLLACDDPTPADTADTTDASDTGAQEGSTSTTGDEPTTGPGGVTLGPELECDGLDAAPQLVGAIPEGYVSLAFSGDLMIGAQTFSTDAVDISDPAAPRILGLETLSPASRFVTVADGRMFFADGDVGIGELTFDQGELRVLGMVDVHLDYPYDFVVGGGLAATTASWEDISVFSLAGLKPSADPPQPFSEIEGPADAVLLADGHLFAAGESLRVFSLADPSLPVAVAEHGLPSRGRGLAWHAGRLYVSSVDPGELRVVDVTDPADPSDVTVVPLTSKWPERLTISGDIMVVEDVGGVGVLDLADPDAPVEVTSLAFPGPADTFGVHRGFLYVAGEERTDVYRLCASR